LNDKQLQLGEDEGHLALTNAWDSVLRELKDMVSAPSFDNWLRPVRPIAIEGDLVRLGTDNPFGKNWVEGNLGRQIGEMLQEKLGVQVKVRFEITSGPDDLSVRTGTLPSKPVAKRTKFVDTVSLPLNAKHTFDTFVVGTNNRLAHACAVAVAECPGSSYNPLFIYGGSGLGKTHLLHAMGHHIAAASPDTHVLYVSGEAFTFNYVAAVQERRVSDFRSRFRGIDVFLLDDVHFLVGKERTEEEFFHTFNTIYDMGKQIVLTSDKPPKNLQLDNRLLSRFESGMLADISVPDLETRMAIIRNKATNERLALSDEVTLYIARLITENIRQIEGALIKLGAYSSIMKCELTPSLAEDVLGEYFGTAVQATPDSQAVLDAVARRFELGVDEIKGGSRSREVVVPRQIAMYLCREIVRASLPMIGKTFGGKDHSTVIHSCKKVEAQLAIDSRFAALVEQLVREITGGRNC
jgi:chromosomal replication initiator protein